MGVYTKEITERQLDILRLASLGLLSKQIAAELEIECRTVDWHLAQIYHHLGVHNRIQACNAARTLGLIEC